MEHLTLKVGDIVWLVDNMYIFECTIVAVHDEVCSTDPLYELSNKLLPGGFAFRRLENFFTNHKMALICAIDNADAEMVELDAEIAEKKCEYRFAKKRHKQLLRELEDLHDG